MSQRPRPGSWTILLNRHPDLPDASKIKEEIARLRAGN